MPTISVRISDKEKRELQRHGTLSDSVRDALALYLSTKKSDELLHRLAELQKKNPVTTTTLEEVRLIKEDRNH